ncbi:MAG: acetylglutamate kinase [Candidatus Omnitrophica bacterium]|nr:acetylglutamate kinase [Candidatus Omnitrophota bacterium]
MHEIVEKASVLIEALPYIKKFRGKEILIKYGGAAMCSEEIRENVLQDLVFMNYVGIKPILIHGGGNAITNNLKKKGIQTRFVDGLRVTDKASMEVVVETLAEINKGIVHDINKFGARAIGLSGHDADILSVVKRQASEDVGYVGQITSVNIQPIKELTEFNIIPVIYGVGIDQAGETYNVNADDAAAKIAAAMGVQKLMILTNVKGILRDPADEGSLISSLRVSEVQSLIDQKVISGGMIPKVGACITALNGEVKKAHIVDGRIKHSLLLEIFTDQGIGTEIFL